MRIQKTAKVNRRAGWGLVVPSKFVYFGAQERMQPERLVRMRVCVWVWARVCGRVCERAFVSVSVRVW